MSDDVVDQQAQEKAESDAAFASGFQSASGEEPPAAPVAKAESPAEEKPQPEAPAPAPEPTPAVDPLANVTQQLAALNDRIKAVDDIAQRQRSLEGRYGHITTTLESLAAAKAAAKTVEDAPTPAQIDAAGKDTERWQQLKEDFPDWAEAVDSRFADMQAAVARIPTHADIEKLVDARAAQLLKDKEPDREALRAVLREEVKIDFKHEGWEETVNTPEFEAWFAKQAPEVQALGASSLARDAIRMLDAFVADRKKAAEKETNTQRLKSAITPSGVPNAAPAALNEVDAFAAGFNSVLGGT